MSARAREREKGREKERKTEGGRERVPRIKLGFAVLHIRARFPLNALSEILFPYLRQCEIFLKRNFPAFVATIHGDLTVDTGKPVITRAARRKEE